MADRITHLFFDMNRVIYDGAALHPCYAAALGRVMAGRYGGQATAWEAAKRQIAADWDSYYADLDLGGPDGTAHLWEGLFRTTRALFRITGTPEPDKAEITALSRELPGLLPRECNTCYPDVRPVVERLHNAGFVLGVASHGISDQSRAILAGGGLLDYFQGPIIGPDITGRFNKDVAFYQHVLAAAGAGGAACLLVSDDKTTLQAGAKAGMAAIQVIRRMNDPPAITRSHVILPDLTGLLNYLGVQREV